MDARSAGMRRVADEELRAVRGGSFWSGLKKVGKWIKKHVAIGLKSIGLKGTF